MRQVLAEPIIKDSLVLEVDRKKVCSDSCFVVVVVIVVIGIVVETCKGRWVLFDTLV